MDRYRKEFWQKDLSDVAFFRTVACVIWASFGATLPIFVFHFAMLCLRLGTFGNCVRTSATFFSLVVPISLATARAGRPISSASSGSGSSSNGAFLISRDMVDSSHGVALPDAVSAKPLEARLRNATRSNAKRATDTLAFVVARVFIGGMFLMPMFSHSKSNSTSVGYFGALYAFALSMGSLGLVRSWTTWNWSVRSKLRAVLTPFAGHGDRIVQSSRILSWLEKSRNQFGGTSKDSILREKVVTARANGNAFEKVRLAALTYPRFRDDLHFQFSQTGQRKRYFRVKRIAFDVAMDPVVFLYSAKMVVVVFVAQIWLSWFRLAPSTSIFSLISKFVPGYVVYITFKICRDVCESILTEPYAFRPDIRAAGTEHMALEPLMRAMRGEFVSEYAFSQVLAFDDCLKIASGDDFEYGRLPLLYSGSDTMGSAAFGVVAPGKRRFAADANTDEVGEDEDEDSEKSPDFLDVLSVKRAFLACALAPATAVARAMREFHEKAIVADSRSSAGPQSAASKSSDGVGEGFDGGVGVGGGIGGMLSLEAMQMRKHRQLQASIASRKAAQAVEDYGTLADLGMKIATAMFSNMDEFGDEMMDIVDGGIDRRNNAKVLGEHERPTFRDVAIAVCAYREAVKRVREVTFPDSSVTTTSSAQHNLKGDIGDTVMPQTTNLDGGPEPIIRPSGIPFQTGWTATSTRGRNENVSFWSSLSGGDAGSVRSSSLSSLYSTYPAISQLPVAEAAQIHESFANGVVFKLALLSKNGALFARPGSRLAFLEKAMNKPSSPPILGQFKSRRFSRTEEDENREEERDLRCSYFGDIDSHEKVLAGAVSAFSI